MAHVEFIYGIGSKEAQEFESRIYSIIVDGVEINAANLFNFPAKYSQEIRDRVMYELKVLCEDKSFTKIQRMVPEKLSKTLEAEAAVNRASCLGQYENYNAHFGFWLEHQLKCAARWVREDVEGLLIGQILLAILCHIHSSGFYRDTTMDWQEACRTGRKDIFINNLTEVFAVA